MSSRLFVHDVPESSIAYGMTGYQFPHTVTTAPPCTAVYQLSGASCFSFLMYARNCSTAEHVRSHVRRHHIWGGLLIHTYVSPLKLASGADHACCCVTLPVVVEQTRGKEAANPSERLFCLTEAAWNSLADFLYGFPPRGVFDIIGEFTGV
jgi:hypothetical protein